MGRVVFPPCCLTCGQTTVEVMKITHLEPGILECEVEWALESITTNKASGGDRIPVSCFKSSKMMLSKCCTQYASKFGKLNNGHRTGKDLFSFQPQRKAMSKDVQTTAQLHSKECWKFFKQGFNRTWTMKFQVFKLDLEKAKEPEIKLPTSFGERKS